jgi:C-terminal processing protease CtpA/Prc
MCRSILFFLVVLLSGVSFGQKKVNKELYWAYFKTWNFVKYYHPDLASGRVDADSLFLKHLPEIRKAANEKAFNDVIKDVLSSFSTPLPGNDSQKDAKNLLAENMDFSWLDNKIYFNSENTQQLHKIFQNRYIAEPHYYLPEQSFNAELPHEKEYAFSKEENIPVEYRLLALAKILGAVDYLYPHKYLMEQSFDELLKDEILSVLESEKLEDYEFTLLVLSAALQDSHTFSFYKQLSTKRAIFKNSWYPPFDYQVFEDGILVTEVIVPELCEAHDVKVGDYITSVNGLPVQKKISDLSLFLSVSNRQTLIYYLSNYIDNLIWNLDSKEVNLEILRGIEKQNKTIPFIGSGDPNLKLLNAYLGSLPSNRVEGESLIVLKNDIAYFRINNVFRLIENVEDERIDRQMDSILDLAKSKKGIIFDMRGYPDWGGFVLTYVVKSFGKKLDPYAKYYQVNREKIGTYVLKTNPDAYYNPELKLAGSSGYAGKVVIIVNPATRSMSEWNTMCLQHVFPDALTIGEQSAGADGDLKTMNLPGGYQLDFTGNAIFYPDGRKAQRIGVKIDIPVQLTRENYSKDKDEMLQKAIELIEK